jgi:hypothetical protein
MNGTTKTEFIRVPLPPRMRHCRAPGYKSPCKITMAPFHTDESCATRTPLSEPQRCLICGRRLSWIRRRFGLQLCWRRECRQEFDQA